MATTEPNDATVTALAKAVGVSRRTIYAWFNEGCPRTLADALRLWRRGNKMPANGNEAATSGDADGLSLAEMERQVKIRKWIAAARSQELKNAETEGRIIDRADACLEFSELVNLIRHEIESWPDLIAPELPVDCRVQVTELLRDRAHQLLIRMAGFRAQSMRMQGDGTPAQTVKEVEQ